jgi:hypothetical protein
MKIFISLLLCIFISTARAKTPIFYEVPTDRVGVTMNIFVMDSGVPKQKILIVVPGSPGSDGRVMLKNTTAFDRAVQYFGPYKEMFASSGIALVAMGCPTDQWLNAENCGDDYRSSQQYIEDVNKVISFLKLKHSFKDLYLFGHSSGGISSRWLSLRIPEQFKGVINSSVMNRSFGGLAKSMTNFDMRAIKIPVLNIAHEHDTCGSTPYDLVKNYSNKNLITVTGGEGSGEVCGRSHRHSFAGRQKAVSYAIIRWINTGEVQTFITNEVD